MFYDALEEKFQDAGIKEALNITSTTTTAPQMATLLSLQEADAAILWKENCGDGVDIVPTDDLKPYIKTLPAARLKSQSDNRAADAFSTFLDSDEAHEIWKSFTRPLLLLLDEPFSALDPVTKESMYEMIRRIRAEYHCAIAFVTHDFHEAAELADRVGILLHGTMQAIVPAKELFTHPWNEATKKFLGITK